MSLFSEQNKIVNVIMPGMQSSGQAAAFGTASTESDIVNMENYKYCTFIFSIGATTGDLHWNLVPMAVPTSTGIGVATRIPFYYRSQGTTELTQWVAGSDVPSALALGTTDGIDTAVAMGVGSVYIIEVDAPTVCAAGTSGADFDHVKLYLTGTTAADAQRAASCIAILSEPRYVQDILVTAID